MARGLKAKVENAVVVLIAVVDTDNIPEHMVDWPDGEGLAVGMIDDGSGGYALPTPPTQAEIDAAQEAELEHLTRAVLQNDKKFRVVTGLIFDTLKATRSGNYSAFVGVTDPATFYEHVKERFRALD